MGLPLAKKTLAEFLTWQEAQPERQEFFQGEILKVQIVDSILYPDVIGDFRQGRRRRRTDHH